MNKFVLGVLLMCASFVAVSAIDTWNTGRYENNVDINKTLTLPDATNLEVTISGETEENYDFIMIANSSREIIKQLSGVMNETFEVSGNSIIANLKSDENVTKRGVVIKIRSTAETNESEMFSELVDSPSLDMVLHYGSVDFETKPGVKLYAYNKNTDKVDIINNHLEMIDTTTEDKKLTIFAEKDGKLYSHKYAVESPNPFHVSIEWKLGDGGYHQNPKVSFSNAKTLMLYSETLGKLHFIRTQDVSNLNAVENLSAHWDDTIYYLLVLCGDVEDKFVCSATRLKVF